MNDPELLRSIIWILTCLAFIAVAIMYWLGYANGIKSATKHEEARATSKREKSINSYEQLIVDEIIHCLQKEPERFSCIWGPVHNPQDSVRRDDGKILIDVDGKILDPKVKMGDNDKNRVKELIEPIIDRDYRNFAKQFTCKNK